MKLLGTALKREEGGQVMALLAIGITGFLGMAAFAIDVGVWYQLQRKTQAAADAGALAAAQYLPSNPSTAQSTAQTYVNKNISGATTTISTPYNADSNKIHVKVTATSPTFFAKVFGMNSVTVSADSTAAGKTGGAITTGYWIMPFAVSGSCGGSGTAPCVGTYTSGSTSYNYLSYHHLGSCTGSTYSFCFTNLDSTITLSESLANDSTLGSYILNGYPSPVTVPFESGDYKTNDCKSSPCTVTNGYTCGHNANPNSCMLIQDLIAKAGDIILVPVFDPSKTKSLGHFYLEGFAVFQVNSNSSMVFQNSVDPSHWWITGNYLTNITCAPPPGQSGDGSQCYGTSSGSGTGNNYGVGAGTPIALTE